jgi:hypothetical protein
MLQAGLAPHPTDIFVGWDAYPVLMKVHPNDLKQAWLCKNKEDVAHFFGMRPSGRRFFNNTTKRYFKELFLISYF